MGQERDEWEFDISRYKLLCKSQICKIQLYSIDNYSQYLIIKSWWKRIWERIYMYVYVYIGFLRWYSGKRICLPKQKMQVRSLDQEDLLEKEMVTRSVILAWEIPWKEEPGGLQSDRGVTKSWTQLSDWARIYMFITESVSCTSETSFAN